LSYLLDTNACLCILNGTTPALVVRMRREDPASIKLSSVVRAELLFGARKSSRVEQNLALLSRFFAPFESLPFDDRAAEHYGLIRAELEREGRLIGPNDLLIAATARAHDATLVTRNTKEFARVVALRVENWEGEEQVP
jgi:tRNA(fMet)-specific endonuclease VapC